MGDDHSLRVWDLKQRKCVARNVLPDMARAAAFSPDGRLLAVGLGGRVGGPSAKRARTRGSSKRSQRTAAKDSDVSEGGFLVLQEDGRGGWTQVSKGQPSKEQISDIKFSPDGRLLAVASHDNRTYIYSTDSFRKVATCSGHSSYITHVDFTADGQALRSTCGAYELLLFDASTGKHRTDARSFRGAEWASCTCILGWDLEGIWPPRADGTDINAVDRSSDGRVLATGDDFGFVKLFRYPALHEQYDKYIGHSSHVTNVRWSYRDAFMLSTGGNDKCFFQWKVASDLVVEDPRGGVQDFRPDSNSPDAVAELYGSDRPIEYNLDPEDEEEFTSMYSRPRGGVDDPAVQEFRDKYRNAVQGMDVGAQFELEAIGGGDEAWCVDPMKGSLIPPSDAPKKVDTSPPSQDLELSWVYGVRTDVRLCCCVAALLAVSMCAFCLVRCCFARLSIPMTRCDT